MKHRIETNVAFGTEAADIARVRMTILRKIGEAEMLKISTVFIRRNSSKSKARTESFVVLGVEINGNGALLRDVAFALDVAGMLD